MVFEKKRKLERRYTVYRGGRKITKKERFTPSRSALSVSLKEPVNGSSKDLPSSLQADCPTIVEKEVPGASQRYTKRKESRLDEWAKLRETFIDVGIQSQAIAAHTCTICLKETEQLLRCLDCAMWEKCCEDCIQKRHNYPHLHLFEAWQHGTFLRYHCDTVTWKQQHECDSVYTKTVIVVDDRGRQHIRQICFCVCEPEAATLLRYNLWPSSPKNPRMAFHIDLLRWIHGLQMECQISVKGFCEALRSRLPKHQQRLVSLEIKDVYKVLVTETMDEFRNFYYKMENLSSLHEELDDGTKCAACFDIPIKIYSFDADFQLVRKQSAGKHWVDPKHIGHFFLPQEDVDSFMANYGDSKEKEVDKECNDFQAGSNIRSKVKNSKLSETAVFGSTCRHEVPKYFFSLRHGERLGYAVFLIKKLLEEEHTGKIQVLYDIACLLHSHLKKKNESILEKVSLSIPIFHCYGHKLPCQVLYSPRRTEGLGLTDGESLERLWSYLGKFSKITKEMTPENRVDILVEGLMHYGKKIQSKFQYSLVQKHEKATKIYESSQKALSELLTNFPYVTFEVIDEWAMEEMASCTSAGSLANSNLSPEEEYALCIEAAENLRKSGGSIESKDTEKNEKKLKALEKKLKISTRKNHDSCLSDLKSAKVKKHKTLLAKLRKEVCDRAYLLELIKKYAKGQGIANRLQRQIKRCNTDINNTVALYNEIGEDGSACPDLLSFDEVKAIDASFYSLLDDNSINPSVNVIPQSIKKQAISYQALMKRAIEEHELCKLEMKSVLNFNKHQHTVLRKVFESQHAGIRSVVFMEGISTELDLWELHTAFQPYIGDIDLPSVFVEMAGMQSSFAETSIVQDIVQSEELDIRRDEDTDSEIDDDDDAED